MDIAQAYVQILPTTEGIKENLTSVLSDAGTSAGKSAGSRMGSALSTGMKMGSVAMGAITAGVTAASGAFVASAQSTATYGDAVDKTSQKLGLSAKAYQEWDYVMNLAGTSMGDMTTGMKTLTNKLDDAKNGSEKAQAMFSKLGISMDQVNSMSREELFAATIAGFQGMSDSTERAALANDLFGKSGQNLTPLFNQSSEATQGLIDKANDLGMIMSDDAVAASAAYQDSLTTLQGTMGGMQRAITSEFMPSITTVMDGLGNLFGGNSEEGLGQIKEGVSQFIGTLTEAIPKVIEVGSGIVGALGEAIMENLPSLLDAGLQAIITLANGISQSLPAMVPQIVEVVTKMVEVLTNPDTLTALLTAALAIIVALAEGIIKSIPKLVEALPTIISNLVQFFINAGPTIAKAGYNLLVSLVKNLPQIISSVITAIPKIISSVVSAVASGVSQLASAGYTLLCHLGDKFSEAGTWLSNKVKSIPNSILKALQNTFESFKTIGKNLITGLWNGFAEKWNSLQSTIKGWADSAVNLFKSVFGISSPSKVFAEIGGYLDAGLAKGITDNTYLATDAMADLGDSVTAAVGTASMSVGISPAYVPQAQTVEVPRQSVYGSGTGQQTAYLVLDKEVLGRVVYSLYQSNDARVGVQLAGGMA